MRGAPVTSECEPRRINDTGVHKNTYLEDDPAESEDCARVKLVEPRIGVHCVFNHWQ